MEIHIFFKVLNKIHKCDPRCSEADKKMYVFLFGTNIKTIDRKRVKLT
jgi:hypothetical protein